jgi:hypothetical protein
VARHSRCDTPFPQLPEFMLRLEEAEELFQQVLSALSHSNGPAADGVTIPMQTACGVYLSSDRSTSPQQQQSASPPDQAGTLPYLTEPVLLAYRICLQSLRVWVCVFSP